MGEAAALDSAELEATGQISDWVDIVDTEGAPIKRVRLTFIASAQWFSIESRKTALVKGASAIEQRLEEGTSDDPAADAARLGSYKTSLLEVAGETVARSVRQIEGQEPFEVIDGKLKPSDVEALALDGLFWETHTAVVQAHWTSPEQVRALFRSGLGQPV